MRKIIESTLLSLDGVIGDPHVWASERFADEARDSALAQLRVSGGMLMGRRTYEIFSVLAKPVRRLRRCDQRHPGVVVLTYTPAR